MVFCERLRDLRTEKQLTQKQLAQSLGFSANIICEWEKARCEPNSETLKNLADFFQCSVDFLLGREDDFGNITISSPSTASLPNNEHSLLQNFRKLPADLQHRACAYMEKLVELTVEEKNTTFPPAGRQERKAVNKNQF